jgi:glycosyltransferase involved in cell wall biosynthesis
LKIAVIEPDPSFGGGSERVVLDLGRGLTKRGHSLFLIHSAFGTMMEQYLEFVTDLKQTSLVPFGWRTLPNSLGRVAQIRRLLNLWKIDWILCSCPHYVELLSFVRRVCNTKVCFHLGLPGTNSSFIMKAAQRKIDIGVAPSYHTAESWSATGWIADRLHVVANGVDTNRFQPRSDNLALRSKYGIDADSLVVAYVGRLVPEKGIGTLLQAFSAVSRRFPNAKLVLAGKNTLQSPNWPQRAVEVGIPSRQISFLGTISEPSEIYAIGDLAVVPSECQEAFGLTAVEAMACGKPVVTSDVGVFDTLVGSIDEQLVFPAANAAALTERLYLWLSDESRRRTVGEQARKVAVARYSVEEMTDQYESIMQNHPRRDHGR